MKTKLTVCWFAFGVIFGNAALAQKPTDPPTHLETAITEAGFGTASDTIVTLSARDMQPYEPGGGVISDDGYSYRWMTAGSNKLFEGSMSIPAGVTITGFSIHYCDTDPASNFVAQLWDFYGDHGNTQFA